MAKSKNLFVCLLLAVLAVCAPFEGTVKAEPATSVESAAVLSTPDSFQLEHPVLVVAKSYIGVKELTGNNDGPEIKRFLAFVGIHFEAPWCAAFVSVCLAEAGYESPRTAWSPSCFPASKTVYKRTSASPGELMPADLIGLFYSNLGRVGHVGIIEYVRDKYVISIEGNTNDAGSREGNMVARKRRPKSTIYIGSRWKPLAKELTTTIIFDDKVSWLGNRSCSGCIAAAA